MAWWDRVSLRVDVGMRWPAGLLVRWARAFEHVDARAALACGSSGSGSGSSSGAGGWEGGGRVEYK